MFLKSNLENHRHMGNLKVIPQMHLNFNCERLYFIVEVTSSVIYVFVFRP